MQAGDDSVSHSEGRGREGDPDTRVYPAPDTPNGLFPVTYRKLLPITAPRARYPGYAPGTTVLKAGTVRRDGARPLMCNIIFERDVAMKLRDGTTIYTDIFRPEGDAKVPAIFSWSPYGKELGGQWLDDLPEGSGVPLKLVSELQRFEGADPAYWCAHGYAVVNPDPRGAPYVRKGTLLIGDVNWRRMAMTLSNGSPRSRGTPAQL